MRVPRFACDTMKFNFVQAAPFAEMFEIRSRLRDPVHFVVNFSPKRE